MKIRASSILASVIAGGVGAVVALSIGAAHFRMADPVPFSFTYQGQLRNGASLVNGTVDLRFTMWDAATGGQQIGSLIERPGIVARDGRFATELDFGASAFNGDARFVQTEVRSPAGVGQYLALQPRQQITAVPYAMYALNSGDALWRRTADAGAVYVPTGNVGIGTSNPTSRLHVVGPEGDSTVSLPNRSIGMTELMESPVLVAADRSFVDTMDFTVVMPRDGLLVLDVEWIRCGSSITVDGLPMGEPTWAHFLGCSHSQCVRLSGRLTKQLSSGPHRIQSTFSCQGGEAVVRAWVAGGVLPIAP